VQERRALDVEGVASGPEGRSVVHEQDLSSARAAAPHYAQQHCRLEPEIAEVQEDLSQPCQRRDERLELGVGEEF